MKSLEKLEQKLRYKRYAERTIEVYLHYTRQFFIDQKIRDPYQVSTAAIVEYLENREYSSRSQQNQIISALKAFAEHILGKKEVHLKKIERPRKEIKLQPVIPRPLMVEKLAQVKNLKHKAILSLGYGCGLRVSEVINLRWDDISREAGIIHIKGAKGQKDRMVAISDTLIQLLINYWKQYRTKGLVFTGHDWRPQYSASSCNALVKKHIGEQYRFHSLRKSFATHLYEAGNDLAKIQDALGHANQKTTRIYVSSSAASVKQLDALV